MATEPSGVSWETVVDSGAGETEAAVADAPADTLRATVHVCLSIVRPRTLLFAPGGTTVLDGCEQELDLVARVMADHPELVVDVEGHTDSVERNRQRLSEQRARVVKKALVDRGVDASRLCIRPYAETRPIAPNATAGDRAKNRRVEFRVVEGDACLP